MNVDEIIAKAEKTEKPEQQRAPLKWFDATIFEGENEVKYTVSMTEGNFPRFSIKPMGKKGAFLRPFIVAGELGTPPRVGNREQLLKEQVEELTKALDWVDGVLKKNWEEKQAYAARREAKRDAALNGSQQVVRKTGKTERDRNKKKDKKEA